MRILVVGSGGREHALAWRLVRDGAEVIVAPGSDGIATTTECATVDGRDHEAIVALARQRKVDVMLVGPEQPLVDGLADRGRAAGLAVFGPGAEGAALEGSKAFAKAFMERHDVPTARARVVTSVGEVADALAAFAEPPVVKADGLAAGKGVTVAQTWQEAEQAVLACLEQRAFGDAGARVVLEQRLVGEEASLFIITDGNAAVWMAAAQDHKRIGDGDTGPNTGGMGAYAPAPVFSAAVRERVARTIVAPTIAGMRSDSIPFRGVVFVGLMIDPTGQPSVIEYNCRFGDPEIQALCLGARAPLGEVILAAAEGRLVDGELAMAPTATVVMAAAGYPGTPRNGDAIHGLEAAARLAGVQVFHAGTRRTGDGFVTNGGRVLGVAATGDTLREAVDRSYAAVRCISFAGAQVRTDVGARAFV